MSSVTASEGGGDDFAEHLAVKLTYPVLCERAGLVACFTALYLSRKNRKVATNKLSWSCRYKDFLVAFYDLTFLYPSQGRRRPHWDPTEQVPLGSDSAAARKIPCICAQKKGSHMTYIKMEAKMAQHKENEQYDCSDANLVSS